MGIFSRLAQLIRSNLNDLIGRSEDPEKMLNQVVLDMSTQLVEAKKQVATSIADEKRLGKQFEQAAAAAADWERRAMVAVRANNEELAKEALARKREQSELAAGYREQWEKQKASVEQLKKALRVLNDKIEEAKRKKNILIARKKRAEAQKTIQSTMGGMQNQGAFETFDRMAEKVDQLEAEAEAQTEIAEEYTGDTLAAKFDKLEATTGTDDDLVALKRKMGLLPSEPEQTALQNAPTRVQTQPSASEQEELSSALEELENEQSNEARRKQVR